MSQISLKIKGNRVYFKLHLYGNLNNYFYVITTNFLNQKIILSILKYKQQNKNF